MPEVIEKMLRFPVDGQIVVGTLHLPPGPGLGGVLLLHGLKSNRVSRKLVKVSRGLAARGVASLRVDYRGSGESEGEFEDATVRTAIEDAQAGLQALARVRGVSSRRLGVAGSSLGGGVVAAELLGMDRRLKAAVLWSAPARFAELVESTVAEAEAAEQIQNEGNYTQGAYRFTQQFITDARTVDPTGSIRKTHADLLVIQGAEDRTVPPDHGQELYDMACRRRTRGVVQELLMLPGADHGYHNPQDEATVIDRTIDWLAPRLGPDA